jgi:hypothetical protein
MCSGGLDVRRWSLHPTGSVVQAQLARESSAGGMTSANGRCIAGLAALGVRGVTATC